MPAVNESDNNWSE